jgi:hypothetical protein
MTPAPRTPKATSRTASGKSPRSARQAEVMDQVDEETDDVAVVGELPSDPEVSPDPESEVQSGMVAPDGQPLKTDTVTFRGRTMVVKIPDEVQLAIIKRFSEQYGSMAKGGQQIEASKAITMSGRAISIVQSVLADEQDKEWIEDSLLRNDFGLMDALDIVNEAMVRLKAANAPNRQERREAAKKSRLVTE